MATSIRLGEARGCQAVVAITAGSVYRGRAAPNSAPVFDPWQSYLDRTKSQSAKPDGDSALAQLTRPVQNACGVVFCELDDMEETLKLTSEHAFAALLPPKPERFKIPPGFKGTQANLVVIARQGGEDILKTCVCFQLGARPEVLGVRTAEVALPAAKTVEFQASLACEPECADMHKALSNHDAVQAWTELLSKHFDAQPTELYNVFRPKDPATPAAVKFRVSADKADALEAKSGISGIIVRRWLVKGTKPPITPLVWLRGPSSVSCAMALAQASRCEGFLGLVRKDGKYAARFDALHLKKARQALDPTRYQDDNIGLVPTASWIVSGFPPGTDREQVHSLLREWGWTVIPGQPNRSAWTAHAACPPPAARCYASCGPLLIKPVSGAAQLPSTTAQAGIAVAAPMDVEPSPVVASPLPLCLREELDKHVSAIRQSLSNEVAEDLGDRVNALKQSQAEVLILLPPSHLRLRALYLLRCRARCPVFLMMSFEMFVHGCLCIFRVLQAFLLFFDRASIDALDSLVLCLRRATPHGRKSRVSVQVPLWLDFAGQCYSLRLAVLHLGSRADSGHYVALEPCYGVGSSSSVVHWTLFDDAVVRNVSVPRSGAARLGSPAWDLSRDAVCMVYRRSAPRLDPVPPALTTVDGGVAAAPQLHLVNANITSWFSGWPQLARDLETSLFRPSSAAEALAPPSLWFLQETHLSPSAVRSCAAGLSKLHLHSVFRCGPASKAVNTPHESGVAVVATVPLRLASFKNPLLCQLQADGRLLHAVCALRGSDPLHAVVFYGYPGGTQRFDIRDRTEQAIAAIAEECIAWGNVPVVLAGDFNFPVDDSHTLAQLQLRGWHDAAWTSARSAGATPPPTCFAQAKKGAGTRVDALFLNPRLASALCDVSYPASGLPVHKPIVASLQVAVAVGYVVKHPTPVRQDSASSATWAPPSDAACDAHVQKLWGEVAPAWQRARNTGDVVSLWPLHTRVADLHYRWYAGIASSPRAPCRGLPGRPKRVRMAPPRLRDCGTSPATAVKNAARQRFLRSLEHAARLRLRVADASSSVDAERELRALWQHLCQRAAKYVPGELWTSWFAAQAPLPEYQSLCLAVDFVSSAVTRQHEAETRCRLSSWRETCRARWRDPKQKRHIFSWVRDCRAPPLVSVKLPSSGSVSFEATDVERVLWSKWQPVFCPGEGEAPSVDFDAFWRRFRQYAVSAPVALPRITAAHLRDAIRSMSDSSSGGADGWTVSELKSWPDFLLQKLADLLNDVEDSGGRWPPDLLLQVVALVPKDSTEEDQRPITVATLVYRAWASVRARQLSEWAETWAAPTQFGYRRGKRSVDPAWLSAAAAEQAWIKQSHRMGFSLDLAKAYDSIPHQVLYNLLVHSGLPVSFCDTWLGAIRGARKFLKTAHGLGREFSVNRGLPQGDALACIGMNLLMSVWSRAVASETAVSVRSYADDATLEAEGGRPVPVSRELRQGICVTEEFMSLTGQQPNVLKSFGWATTRTGRLQIKALQLQGQPLPLKAASKDLGCQVVFHGPRRTQIQCERFSKARKAAKRARCAPLPLLQKAQLVCGAASSLANYGLETCFVGERPLQELKQSIVCAIWGPKRRIRSADAVLLLFTQAHLTDPFQARFCQSFCTLQRCLLADDACRRAWPSWWRTASARAANPRGPVSLLWSLVSEFQWTWPSPFTLRTATADLNLLTLEPSALAHELREAARLWAWRRAFRLHKRFDGVQHSGVDRAATMHLHASLSDLERGFLRGILADAQWTSSRAFNAGEALTSACPSCGAVKQDTLHYFWACPDLRALQAQHGELLSLKDTPLPWPSCLTLCGLVPADFAAGPSERKHLATLTQRYLLDVCHFRAGESAGVPDAPESQASPPEAAGPGALPQSPGAAPVAVVSEATVVLPDPSVQCSAAAKRSVFPWPAAFRNDLVTYLRTLCWPSARSGSPNGAGITWAEIAVNFEAVVGKSLPRTVTRQGNSRPYGAPSGDLLRDQADLFQKIKTMSNACRSLARCLGTPVVAGVQTRQKIPLKDCFDGRVGSAVQSSIQEISALEVSALMPGSVEQTAARHTLYKQGS
ncbi:pol, partial [Symbiodinium necroappetens]